MNAQQVENLTQDNEVADIALEISGTLQGAFDILVQRREDALAAAVAPLDAERTALVKENNAIGEAAQSLEELLPAKARVAQAEHDRLLVAGDREGAAEKLMEQKQAEDAPATMRTRQGEIARRIEAIEEEKRNAAKCVLRTFYAEGQQVVRAMEAAFFVGGLDRIWSACLNFESEHCPQRTVSERPALSGQDRFNLTADEKSESWVAAQRWYSGRTR